ncbi:DoxX family protein [Dyadobacter psychrotolerans]|uniref:DoxX family protein n=1 Tax=Dyadobacter psychrotolerans TaxID=2541721 RepID=A0A4R5DHP3_9BACT|nr:DoxX family protein [Dyadobacter psychrotolerans]TDE13612.1 DoxX family protein [Dyadobacter psychrotolerans]
MGISARLDKIHLQAKSNKWMNYFAIFLRVILAYGFIASGMVKILGERFAVGLSANHPMGQYLVALHHTGFYYTFIGVVQVIAALLLVIPRTVILGALIYFPVILNIFMLSYAVRFEGSAFTSPLMMLACLYLILWNYDKIKYILPFDHSNAPHIITVPKTLNKTFPIKFFLGTAAIIVAVILFSIFGWQIAPRNNLRDCNSQFAGTNRTKAGAIFCDCIHKQGLPLNNSMELYDKAPNDAMVKK